MSDSNPTSSSDNQTPEIATMPSHQAEANRQLLIIGLLGCVFLLCMGLLTGGLFIGGTAFALFDDERFAGEEETFVHFFRVLHCLVESRPLRPLAILFLSSSIRVTGTGSTPFRLARWQER